MGKVLIICGVVLAVALVVVVLIWVTPRVTSGPGVRRRELRRMIDLSRAADESIEQIEKAADLWRDADSPLATEVRKIISEYEVRKKELWK